MYFPDLSPFADQPKVKAIGWLDLHHPFPQGEVSQVFVEALQQHLEEAWTPFLSMGIHPCPFCPQKKETVLAASGTLLWIPDEQTLYVTPGLVSHYIQSHNYQPPDVFMKAVLHCPRQGSPEFLSWVRPYFPEIEASSK